MLAHSKCSDSLITKLGEQFVECLRQRRQLEILMGGGLGQVRGALQRQIWSVR